MDYIVNGKNKLQGELSVYGAKNCALALLGATPLTDDDVVLTNCPQIADVENMLLLLRSIGKKVIRQGETVCVSGSVVTTTIPSNLAKLLRGSGLILGSLVTRYESAFLPITGGCAIGSRPIDIHLDGLRALGVTTLETSTGVQCFGRTRGNLFGLRFASVGATENLLCAAVLAKGTTTLVNCALEPEVVALEQMLQQMGAQICGVGTATVTVRGVENLHGTTFAVIPDRIVAATYLSCVAACGGQLSVVNCVPSHIQPFLQILEQRFVLKRFDSAITLEVNCVPTDYGSVETAPYPGFPTDVQQILLSLCALSNGGTSYIRENLFENRLKHNAEQLVKMGAQVQVEENCAKVVGKKLHGSSVTAMDLRGGVGLVVAALGAEGQSVISNMQHTLRGYSNLDFNLRSVGADIQPTYNTLNFHST